MDIKSLPCDVKEHIRSGFGVSNVVQCVNELVLNSLDAKSNNIAVRLNLTTFRIQIVDDGEGITQENLPFVGKRYYTNKCYSLAELEKQTKFFGYKGETLASIATHSKKLKIATRVFVEDKCDPESGKSLLKTIEGNESSIMSIPQRPSRGTTITVEQFLYNLPIRQKRTKRLEFNEIKANLKALFILHPGVTISLRDDSTKKVLFSSVPVDSAENAMQQQIDNLQKEFIKYYSVISGRINIKILIYLKLFDNKKYQLFYVNKRPVNSWRLTSSVNAILSKSSLAKVETEKNKKKGNFLYVCDISCPQSKYEIVNTNEVEFKNWDSLIRKLERLLSKILIKENLAMDSSAKQRKTEYPIAKQIRLSGFRGAYKACVTRKTDQILHSDKDNVQVGDDEPQIQQEHKDNEKNCYNLNEKQPEKIQLINRPPTPARPSHFPLMNPGYKEFMLDQQGNDKIPDYHEETCGYNRKGKKLHEHELLSDISPSTGNKTDFMTKHDNVRISDYPNEKVNKSDKFWDAKISGPSRFGYNVKEQNLKYSDPLDVNFLNNNKENNVTYKLRRQNNFNSGKDYVMSKHLNDNQLFRKKNQSENKARKRLKHQHCGRKMELPRVRDLRHYPNNLDQPPSPYKSRKSKRYPLDYNFTFKVPCRDFNEKPIKAEFPHVRHNPMEIDFTFDVPCGGEASRRIFSKKKRMEYGRSDMKKWEQFPRPHKPIDDNFTFKLPHLDFNKRPFKVEFPFDFRQNPSPSEFTFACHDEPSSRPKKKIKFDPVNFTFCEDDSEIDFAELDRKSFVYTVQANEPPRNGNFFEKTLDELDFPPTHAFKIPRSKTIDRPFWEETYIQPESRSELKFPFPPTSFEFGREQNTDAHRQDVFFRTLASDLQSHVANKTKTSISFSRLTRYTKCSITKSKSHDTHKKDKKKSHKKKSKRHSKRTSKNIKKKKLLEEIEKLNKVNNNLRPEMSDQAIQCTLMDIFLKDKSSEEVNKDHLTPQKINTPVKINVISDIVIKPAPLQVQHLVDSKNYIAHNDEKMDLSEMNDDIIESTLPTILPTSELHWLSDNQSKKPQTFKSHCHYSESIPNAQEMFENINDKSLCYLSQLTFKRIENKEDSFMRKSGECDENVQKNDGEKMLENIVNDDEKIDSSKISDDIIESTPPTKLPISKLHWLSHNQSNKPQTFKSHCHYSESIPNAQEMFENINDKSLCYLSQLTFNGLENKKDSFMRKSGECDENVQKDDGETTRFNLSIAIKHITKKWSHHEDTDKTEKLKKNEVVFFNANNSLANIFDKSFTQPKTVDTIPGVFSEWSRKIDDQGESYYINERTGNTMHQKPMESENFDLTRRPVYLPKGFSQTLKETPNIVEPVSSGTRREFHAAVCECYENELDSVKWKKHYLQNTDPELFFKQIYEKHFIIDEVSNLKLPTLKKSPGLLNRLTFTKDMFHQLEILRQCDNKFIVAVWKPKAWLVFLDQHAVHERIRVEQLYKCYRNEESGQFAAKSLKQFDLVLKQNVIDDCKKFLDIMKKFGIELTFAGDLVTINSVPECLFNKAMRDSSKRNEKIAELTKALIYEIINCFIDAAFQPQWVPTLLTNLINSEACRGAIMFGDELTKDKCGVLIKELSLCNIPFHCAHGRPTTVPIVKLVNYSKESAKINLKSLKLRSKK